jgi:lipoyl(octanoyl) transferase
MGARGAYLLSLPGTTPYAEAMDQQANLAAARNQGAIPDTVMVLEHDPVISLGSRAVRGEELLLAAVEYTRRGIDVVEVGRGGRSTYHGPGQIVCYPIFDLSDHGKDLHRYVRNLEETIIRSLAELGIDGHRADERHASGVWVEDRKIASIGVRCARWITTHGFSLNVDLDLAVYQTFDACGLGGARFTSVAAELGRSVGVDEVRPVVIRCFGEVFDIVFDELPSAA